MMKTCLNGGHINRALRGSTVKKQELLGQIIGLIGGLSILGGLLILGWQIVTWLKRGEWIEMPVYLLFDWAGIDLTKVYSPSDWIGLSAVLQWLLDLPMSLGIPAATVGGIIIIAWAVSDIVSEIQRKKASKNLP